MRPLAVIGFMGAGKSEAGRRAAELLGWPFVDGDALVERAEGAPTGVLIDRDGEAAFRDAEVRAYRAFLDRAEGARFVLACGGGAPLVGEIAEALTRRCQVVWLDVDAATAWGRVRAEDGAKERPLARDRAAFTALLDARRDAYAAAAERRVDASIPSDEVGALLAAVAGPAGPRLGYRHSGGSGRTEIVVEPDAIHGLGELLAPLVPGRRVALVTDDRVPQAHVNAAAAALEAAFTVAVHVLEAGEQTKTWASAGALIEGFADDGLRRGDAVVALGGGVVGDLAGFAASAYLRGVRIAHVPTTLLAQVDSSIGGKTGVDLPQAKNLAGAFHQPVLVVADPTLLATLPEREWRAGMAEVVKTGLLTGGSLLAGVLGAGPIPAVQALRAVDLVRGCAAYKASIVAGDERETAHRAGTERSAAASRAVLNLGHTLGHAIETAAGGDLVHGEAVAVGLRAALVASEAEAGLDPAVTARVGGVLDAYGLPATAPAGLDRDAVRAALGHDKKGTGGVGEVGWVLLSAPGQPEPNRRLPAALVDALVARFCPA